ncbi:MAG: hypothetical protein ACK572_04280 [Akkermansiaceae bacterium]
MTTQDLGVDHASLTQRGVVNRSPCALGATLVGIHVHPRRMWTLWIFPD